MDYRAVLEFNVRDDPVTKLLEEARGQLASARDCVGHLREVYEAEVGSQVDEMERLRQENYRLRMLLRKEEE